MTFEESLRGKAIPANIRETLTLIDIPYFSMEGRQRIGQMVLHEHVASEIREIFAELLQKKFPIAKMSPIILYTWDDNASMEDNNTSAFNYRTIADTDRLSTHSYGLAIDINPMQNPYIKQNGTTLPKGAIYDTKMPGTITPEVAKLFLDRGWKWGGDWTDPKDWQHFEKAL